MREPVAELRHVILEIPRSQVRHGDARPARRVVAGGRLRIARELVEPVDVLAHRRSHLPLAPVVHGYLHVAVRIGEEGQAPCVATRPLRGDVCENARDGPVDVVALERVGGYVRDALLLARDRIREGRDRRPLNLSATHACDTTVDRPICVEKFEPTIAKRLCILKSVGWGAPDGVAQRAPRASRVDKTPCRAPMNS